jgi:hypothetical protein
MTSAGGSPVSDLSLGDTSYGELAGLADRLGARAGGGEDLAP